MTHELTQRYLRRATRGLWGRRRREVREELEAHLHDRVMAYRIGGLGEAEAVERALVELGSPQEVSVGMTRLYILPTVMGSSLALAAACVLVVALLPKGAAQSLSAMLYWPSPECVETLDTNGHQADSCIKTGLWVKKQALRRALESQGVKFEYPLGSGGLLRFNLPDSQPIYVPLGSPGKSFYNENGDFVLTAPGFLSFWDLVETVALQTAAHIRVEGWDTPRVYFDDVSLQIGTREVPVAGMEFYESYLGAVFDKNLSVSLPHDSFSTRFLSPWEPKTNSPSNDKGTLREASIRVTSRAAGVYGVVTYVDPKSESMGDFSSEPPPAETGFIIRETAFIMQVFEAAGDGTTTVKLPKASNKFVENFGALSAPGMSVMVRLAGGNKKGEGWFEIVPSENITLEPTL